MRTHLSSSARSSALIPLLAIALSSGCRHDPRPDLWSAGPLPTATASDTSEVELRPLKQPPLGSSRGSREPDEREAVTTPAASLARLSEGSSRMTREARAEGDASFLPMKPHAIVLSCSDHALAPEDVFDAAPGELYVVKTAGEAIGAMTLASIDQAIARFEPLTLVVLGHDRCTAVHAALTAPKTKLSGKNPLDRVSASIRPHLGDMTLDTAGARLERAAEAQARGAARDLFRKSAAVKSAVTRGQMKLLFGTYDSSTASVQLKHFTP